MQRRATPLTILSMLARLAMVLPFLALALVPQGYMPDRAAAGGMVLVLCTPEGEVEMTVDPATGQPQQRKTAVPCDWSLALAGGPPPQPVTLPLPALSPLQDFAATETDLWCPAHDPRGIFARGPPSLT